MPQATCRPKLMRSFTVGFWGHKETSEHRQKWVLTDTSPPPTLSTDPLRRADETKQVSVAHVGQQHLGKPLGGYHDADESKNVWVMQATHEQPLPQESLHLLYLCDA